MHEPKSPQPDPAPGAHARPTPSPSPGPSPAPPEPDAPSPDPASPGDAEPVAVAVTRSGGFAGLTRRWRAEPPPAERPQWIALIDRCPWDAASTPPSAESPNDAVPATGADRFVWWIEASYGEDPAREAELPDDAVVGAWRELIDAVRDWSRAEG